MSPFCTAKLAAPFLCSFPPHLYLCVSGLCAETRCFSDLMGDGGGQVLEEKKEEKTLELKKIALH
jgi:hypothetical protein